MNILFISSSKTWGGGEVWLSQICEGLAQRGHTLVVACQPESKILHQLSRSRFETVPLRMSGDFNPFSILKVYRLIKSRNIGLVCTNMEKELRIAGIAAFLANVPIIISREIDFPIKNKNINKFFYNHIASGIIVNSYATYNTLLSRSPWLGKQRFEIVWKGIDIEKYRSQPAADLRQEFNLQPEDCIAGFVGRLDEQKGIPTLLDAVKMAVKQNPRLKLVIAGEGNLYGKIRQFCQQNHLEKHIFMSGFREDIPAFLKAIDFLVMPSYWEGFGYTAVEAMAAGKPVIGTTTSSLPEIIESGQTGTLVFPRSSNNLSKAMLKMSNDRARCEKMGIAGMARVKELFQLATMITKTESFFESLARRIRVPATYPQRLLPGEQQMPAHLS